MARGAPRWFALAACRGHSDPEIFYPEPGAGGTQQAAAARAVCSGCPVRHECLVSALAERDGHDWGIRGGTSENERAQMRRRPFAAWSRAVKAAAGSLGPELITMGDHDGRTT